MPVIVSFMPVGSGALGSVAAVGIGRPRVYESISLNGTTTAAAEDAEIAVICSTEASTVRGAIGATPDAATAAVSDVSSAGFPIPPGIVMAVSLKSGDKLNFKAL